MVLSMVKWTGKVAVVTGASSGIGAAIVDKLVEKGVIVVGIARRSELIEERAKQYERRQQNKCAKGKLYAYKADVSKEEHVSKAFKWIEENIGPICVLINNAGTATLGNLTETTTEEWKKVFDLNVIALSTATREAVKRMRTNKINGHIIHINSTFGHVVTTHTWNVYPASKWAVTALTETLRQELISLGEKIKITSISPGLVATELTTMNRNIDSEIRKKIENMPILTPDDVADGVIYVLSTPEHVQIHELTMNPL